MKSYFFSPSLKSFSATILFSFLCGCFGCIGLAYTGENGVTLDATKSAMFGQLPEEDVRDLNHDLTKFKRLWKENRAEIMQRIRKEVKESENMLKKETERKEE